MEYPVEVVTSELIVVPEVVVNESVNSQKPVHESGMATVCFALKEAPLLEHVPVAEPQFHVVGDIDTPPQLVGAAKAYAKNNAPMNNMLRVFC